jgi:hypothetical protein
LANAELRAARSAVHKVLDPLWLKKRMTRLEAYAMLATKLELTEDECHVGMFDLETCTKALIALQSHANTN